MAGGIASTVIATADLSAKAAESKGFRMELRNDVLGEVRMKFGDYDVASIDTAAVIGLISCCPSAEDADMIPPRASNKESPNNPSNVNLTIVCICPRNGQVQGTEIKYEWSFGSVLGIIS